MKSADDERRIAGFYDGLVDQFGHSPQASNASSRRSLQVRYHALAGAADLTDKRVLGVGCAFGDMGVFLQERFPGVQYEGIGISPHDRGRPHAHPELNLLPEILDLPAREGTTPC